MTCISSCWTGISLKYWHFSHTHKFQECTIRHHWYSASRLPFTVSCNSKVRYNTDVIHRITFFLKSSLSEVYFQSAKTKCWILLQNSCWLEAVKHINCSLLALLEKTELFCVGNHTHIFTVCVLCWCEVIHTLQLQVCFLENLTIKHMMEIIFNTFIFTYVSLLSPHGCLVRAGLVLTGSWWGVRREANSHNLSLGADRLVARKFIQWVLSLHLPYFEVALSTLACRTWLCVHFFSLTKESMKTQRVCVDTYIVYVYVSPCHACSYQSALGCECLCACLCVCVFER